MATRGPKPKPTELHLVQGTYRPERHEDQAENEPKPEGKLEKPKYLKGRAARVWDRIAPKLEWLTEVDSDTLALWCGLQAEYESNLADMPSSRISQIRVLAAELGMTASGRARIGASGKPKKVDPTAKFFG